jgi:hypothetical protein
VLSLASPVLAVRGKPVRRGKRPPDACLFPAHPPPYAGFIVVPKTILSGTKLDALQCARSGAAPGTVRLKGTERKGTPDSAPRTEKSGAGSPRSSVGSEGSPQAHPCAWGERGGPCPATSCLPFALPPPLGLSKKDPKQNQCTPTPVYMGPRGARLVLVSIGAFRRAKRRGRRS